MTSRLNTGPLNDLTGNNKPSLPLFNQKNNSYRETVIDWSRTCGMRNVLPARFRWVRRSCVEKDPLDREKPCGGGIQIQELVEFGPLPEKVIERRIVGCRTHSPENKVFEKRIPREDQFAVTVRGSVYDRYLQERASQAPNPYS